MWWNFRSETRRGRLWRRRSLTDGDVRCNPVESAFITICCTDNITVRAASQPTLRLLSSAGIFCRSRVRCTRVRVVRYIIGRREPTSSRPAGPTRQRSGPYGNARAPADQRPLTSRTRLTRFVKRCTPFVSATAPQLGNHGPRVGPGM